LFRPTNNHLRHESVASELGNVHRISEAIRIAEMVGKTLLTEYAL
jgi:hypothetical protein